MRTEICSCYFNRAKRDAPFSIRGRFGLCDTQNSVHGSDCVENAFKEISFIFPDFSCEEWLRNHQLN